MNIKKIALFLTLCIVISTTGIQSPELQSYCNYIAKTQNRYAIQYAGDTSSQRCSFCQYNPLVDQFASGCSVCPNYANGQCQSCSPGYLSTNANICISCGDGISSCCAGNNATTDPNYINSVNGPAKNNISSETTTYNALVQYTGVRQVTCAKGYFAAGHACLPLPLNCSSMIVQNDYYYCKTCSDGFYFNNNNECVQECSAYYDDSKTYKKCGSCSSATLCSSCVGSYYLQPDPSLIEIVTDNIPTSKTLQVCSPCMANCLSCSKGIKTCDQCASYSFYDNTKMTCTTCKDPTQLVVNSGLTARDFYSACSDNNQSIYSYTYNTSVPSTQTDALGLPIVRPIVVLTSGKRTACTENCTLCAVKGETTVCSKCINGFYLNLTTDLCMACSDIQNANAALCQWNYLLSNTQNPQILACKVNPQTDLTLPYSQAFFLQFDFNQANFGTTFADYDNTKVCAQNVNNCKEMINTPGAGYANLSLCSSCYSSASDFAAGASTTPAANSYYFLTPGKTCQLCNFPGALTCQTSTINTQLTPQTCQTGYQPTPVGANNSCIKCYENCADCDDNGKCLACDTTQAFTALDNDNMITSCPFAYTQPATLAGCTNWGKGTTIPPAPSCLSCQSNFALISNVSVNLGNDTPYTANLCMSCPNNCTQCSQTQRTQCTSCAAGYYLQNGSCLKFPIGCASFNVNGANGGACTYCQYSYRLVNDQFCSKCHGDGSNFSSQQWFDCPGAQCASGSSDDPTSSSTKSIILSSISFISLTIVYLIL